MEPALVPVPFRNLVNCHANLLRYLHFFGVGPDGLLLEHFAQDLHLPLFLAHAMAFPPLLHVFLILFLPDLHQILRVHLVDLLEGPLDCPLLGGGALLVVLAERHVPFHARSRRLGERSASALARQGPRQLLLLLARLLGLAFGSLAGD